MKWVWRILGGILGLITLAIIVLLLLGQRRGAGYVSATVEVARSPAQVWPYITSDDLLKSWISGLIDVKHMDGGPFSVNSRLRLVEVYGGESTIMDMRFADVRPAQDIMFSITTPDNAFKEYGLYSLVPIQNGNGTRLTLSAVSQYHGFLLTLFEPIISHEAQKKVTGDLNHLKTLAETQH